MKYLIATGSRADWGLLEPLACELASIGRPITWATCAGDTVQVLVTGSHLSRQFGYTRDGINERWFPIEAPCLVDMDNTDGVTKSMGFGMIHYTEAIRSANPDCVIILGDRYEMVGVALAAYNAGVKIVHFQGGDVTVGSLDNGYRDVISSLAGLHLVASNSSLNRLNKWRPNVYNVGSLACVSPFGYKAEDLCDYIIALHGEDYDEVLKAIPRNSRCFFIGTNADAGGRLRQKELEFFGRFARHVFINNMPRKEYWGILAGAKALIGNSSSGIFEAPIAGTYTINIGDRQNGREKGPSIIDCPCEAEAIADAIKAVEGCPQKPNVPNYTPYFKKDTIQRSVQLIHEFL